MAQLAFSTFVEKQLALLRPGILPSDFRRQTGGRYACIINRDVLQGNKKPGSAEIKIKTNIKSSSLAGRAIAEALKEMRNTSQPTTYDIIYLS